MIRAWLPGFLLLVALTLGACGSAHRAGGDGAGGPPDSGTVDAAIDAAVDAPIPDAPIPDAVECGGTVCEDTQPTSTCTGSTLTTFEGTCELDGCVYPPVESTCEGTLGCCGGDHCCRVVASNDAVTGSPLRTGRNDVPPAGMFDTDSQCTTPSALGNCAPVDRAGLPQACVCRTDTITIGNLRIVGTRALVILAWESITVTGTLDVSGDVDRDGPGGAIGFASDTTGSTGGAGGSHGTVGAGTSPPAHGTPELVPLDGGRRGQASAVRGGGAGGALQLTAGQTIEVTPTGVINAGGGGAPGGLMAGAIHGGAGGGSGGAVLLEAPSVTVLGTVAANGGGGSGAGGTSGNGTRGLDATGPAVVPAGGQGADAGSCLGGAVSGGDGGRGASEGTAAAAGQAGQTSGCTLGGTVYVADGGNGGGAGRIRVNTISGCTCSGTFSPAFSPGTTAFE